MFKNITLQNTIFVIGTNNEVAQLQALADLINNSGHDPSPLQAGKTLIQQLTDKVNATLYSINSIPSDAQFQNDMLKNQITSVNQIRCNQLMPAIGAFWNTTASILDDSEGQIQDLPGPLGCQKLDANTDSYPIGGPVFDQNWRRGM